jgi:hypothetical protein
MVGIAMAVAYAQDNADDSHFAEVSEEAVAMLSALVFPGTQFPGAQLVNTFPWCKCIASLIS